jgi:hypothetical protein
MIRTRFPYRSRAARAKFRGVPEIPLGLGNVGDGTAAVGVAQELLGRLARGRSDLRAREHARELAEPIFSGRASDTRRRETHFFTLFDDEVRIGEGRDRGEVGDAENLAMARDVGDGAPDPFRHGAPHAGVDLVEDVEARRTAVGEGALEREQGTRKLAARGDATQRARFDAGVGRDQELDAIDAVATEPRPLDFEIRPSLLGRHLDHDLGFSPRASSTDATSPPCWRIRRFN